MNRIGVIGGGAFGTALANAAAAAGRDVVLWMRDGEAAARAARDRETGRLPGLRLGDGVAPTARPETLGTAEALLLALPAQATRTGLGALAAALPPGVPLVACAKGIERGTGLLPPDLVAAVAPGHPVAILSGPSFAADLASGLPTALVLASRDAPLAERLAAALAGPALRIYSSDDPRGVAIGGAAKNVLAIAVGIVAGRGLGESAGAALTARGFAEMLRLADALGGRPATLMGLSGLGDVVLSCGSARSRNFSLGVALGRGGPPGDASGPLAEGAATAGALAALARAAGIEMPVADAVASVLAGELSVDAATAALMARPLRPE